MTPTVRTRRKPPVLTVQFELHRDGRNPCVTFRPGGIGSVADLTRRERDELVAHVRSIMRAR